MRNALMVFVVLFSINLIEGCQAKSKKDLFQGEWQFVATYDLDSGKKIVREKSEDSIFAVIKPTTVTLTNKSNPEQDEVLFWEIKGDTLYLKKDKELYSFLLNVLNEDKLEVDYYFIGHTRLELTRCKK